MKKYECDGQISVFDFLISLAPKNEYKTPIAVENNICQYSGHSCNKENVWDVADECGEGCPHICCRMCGHAKMCGAACNGSERR
jgi:hypothetical protein